MIKRILTGIVLLILCTSVLIKGGIALYVLVGGIGLLAGYEMIKLFEKGKFPVYKYPVLVLLTAFFVKLPELIPTQIFQNPYMINLFCLVLVISLLEVKHKKIFYHHNKLVNSARIIILLAITLPYIILLRELNFGLFYVFYVFIIVWVTDTMAYFGGKKVGKTPISDISPNKTIEGSIIGILSSVIATSLYVMAFELPLNLFVSLAFILSVLSQVGDIHESLIKRKCKAKDSSNILPGHGGVYDRMDSTLFVMPVMYIVIVMLLGGHV